MKFSDVNWQGAHIACLKSGLSRADFHRSEFKRFCKSHVPALTTMYSHFQALDKAGKASVAKPASKPVAIPKTTGSEVRVVTLTSEDVARGLRAADEARLSQIPRCRTSQAPLRPFRIQLPNGTRLEFDSVAPEALALRMVGLTGGAT